MMCYECEAADVSEPSKRITFEPCGHSTCYACMIEHQVEHTTSTASIGKRMKCACGVKVDEHVWSPDGDGEMRMSHSDPELDPALDGARIYLKQVKEKCNDYGEDQVLGRRGLLHTTQLLIPANGGGIEHNTFELSANGEWLLNPNDGKRCVLGCALMHSAVHPLSSSKKDASDDRSSSSIWNQNDNGHACSSLKQSRQRLRMSPSGTRRSSPRLIWQRWWNRIPLRHLPQVSLGSISRHMHRSNLE